MVGEKATGDMPTDDIPSNDLIRDHLSNKRTMLAWARTGIAVMALGFVVARFGLVLRELHLLPAHHITQGFSTAFGVALVAIGGLLVLLAAVDYLRAGRDIERQTYHWSPALEITLSLLLVLAAIALAIYLVLTG